MKTFLILFLNLFFYTFAHADGVVKVTILPKVINGKMGDIINFESEVKNLENKDINGLVVYISLVKITAGKELPMDLEDWNAQKGISISTLKKGVSIKAKWPMRLIDSGDYVVYITAVDKNERTPIVSEMSNLKIIKRQSLNPNNIIPVAIGIPLLLSGIFIPLSLKRRRKK